MNTNGVGSSNIQERALQFCADRNVAPDALLDRAECARFLDRAVGSLAVLATYRAGPPYRLAYGKAYYVALDAAAWLIQWRNERKKTAPVKVVRDRDAMARAMLSCAPVPA